MITLSHLSQAIDEGNCEKAVQLTTEALNAGMSLSDIITHGLRAGMAAVGDKFSKGEYFLPDMLMAARAMKTALELLKPYQEKPGMPTIGKFLIGTVEGDIHDIGKNMVTTLLNGNGFEVIDLGINVPTQKFIDEVMKNNPEILGLSALLTTTMPEMGKVIRALEKGGLRPSVKVIVGGAPVTEDYANFIGADGYAHDAGKAVEVCRQLLGKVKSIRR